jgi:transketolase
MQDIINELKNKASVIRQYIIQMLGESGSGHPGGSLSCTDILVCLYFREIQVDTANPHWEKRDRFVLSKGHAAPALYAVLAEKGFFPVSELMTLRKFGSILQGHPDMKKVPGVEMSTGSLGQGLSAANGMAIAGKIDKADYRVYAIIGDGESEEGQIWEAAMTAVHYKLDNLTVFMDYNQLQIDGRVSDVKYATNPVDKWKAFGWNVLEIDGHDIPQILDALDKAKQIKGKPTMIVAHTIKGKGVSFMEDKAGWHGKAPNKDETEAALKELGGGICG